MDAFVGNAAGQITYFRNDRTPTSHTSGGRTWTTPSLTRIEWNSVDNPFNGLLLGFADADNDGVNDLTPDVQHVTPAFADVDNDGDIDAVVGCKAGHLYYFRNDGGAGNAPSFVRVEPGDAGSTPYLADGTSHGSPFFGAMTSTSYTVPAFADLDGDGAVDLFVGFEKTLYLPGGAGSYQATRVNYFINHFERTSVPQLNFNEITYEQKMNPMVGVDVGSRAAPAFADVDNDGDLDAFVSNGKGRVFAPSASITAFS
jgi:hypothetical protein